MSIVDKKFNYLKIAFRDIATATDNFAEENVIRQNEQKTIYKGQLSRSGELINIAALRFSSKSWRRNEGFLKEITILSSLQHQNLASIVAFCDENGERIIITKFESKGSLDQHLHDPRLSWTRRIQICLGIARALSHIHYDRERSYSVIHGNVKSSKILLDDNWEAKLLGFELSKTQPVALRQGVVHDRLISGTCAYVDPAYARSGNVTHKSDMYSLGVVLFEVLCGRKAFVEMSDLDYFMDELDFEINLSSFFSKSSASDLAELFVVGQAEGQGTPSNKRFVDEAGGHGAPSNKGLVDQAERQKPRSMEGFLDQARSCESVPSFDPVRPPPSDDYFVDQAEGQGPGSMEGFFDQATSRQGVPSFSDPVRQPRSDDCFVVQAGSRALSSDAIMDQVGGHDPLLNDGLVDQAQIQETLSNSGFVDQVTGQAPPSGDEGFIDEAGGHGAPSNNGLVDQAEGQGPPSMEGFFDQAGWYESVLSFNSLVRAPPSDDWPVEDKSGVWISKNRAVVIRNFRSSNAKKKRRKKKKKKEAVMPKRKPSSVQYMITMKSLQHLDISYERLLANLAKTHYENQTLDDIILPSLREQMDSRSLEKFSGAAYYCLKEQPIQRPNIDRVILALEQALEFQVANERSVEGSKLKHLEHLKIGLDIIESAKKCFIAKGAYGSVYKAELDSSVLPLYKAELPRRSIMVAIKDIIYREDNEGEKGFLAEIEILSSCDHRNIVSLLGFCYEPPRMILVFEHVSNGSLEDYLGREAKMINLTWVQRLNICIDIARGLEYIHSTIDIKHKIIHRDIKSANILLGENWEAKIADFGLSMFQPLNNPQSTIYATRIAGTDTYLDPEYEDTGVLKKESDVYSFGVVLFEILTGRFAYEWVTKDNERGLAPIVRQHLESKRPLQDMVDHKLKEETDRKTFTLSDGPNKESLRIFSNIGYKCLSEKQDMRPSMLEVITELEEALKSQETHKDGLRISLEDIKTATQQFNHKNLITWGFFATLYRGELLRDNESTPIVAKRNNVRFGLGKQKFQTELSILSKYKHKNIISILGYCEEEEEQVIVYEYGSNGSLDRHLKDASLTWTKRLMIGIDVAKGLDFLHGGDSTNPSVIHRDIKSAHIQLDGEWKAKITDFGLSVHAIGNEIDFVVDDARGTPGYVDPQYDKQSILTRESDIYSLGVVLFEMMCGRLVLLNKHEDLVPLVKRRYEEGKLDELVFEDIKDKIRPESLTVYKNIAYKCLNNEIEKRPKANEVVLQLEKALEFQEDAEIWEAKLPADYKEIIQMSKTPKIYSNVSNKYLCEIFSKGILLQKGKVFFSQSSNGERNEMVSATKFSYKNNLHNKRISIQNLRFQKAVKMMDVSDLNIQIKIKTQFLTPHVIYGAHLVFKFCEPRKFSSKLMYVNLKYKTQGQSLHAYFATRENDEWLMIELCRFIPYKKDVDFEVLLESLSRYYCGSGAIYIEGIRFQAINDATLKIPEADAKPKGLQRELKSSSDIVPQVSVYYDEITQLEDGEKFNSVSKADDRKCHMLPAKKVLYDTSDVNRYNWTTLAESRFQEAVELLSHQVLQIKCKIESHKLSNTNYACYLVFRLSQQCHGLHCPVRVRDLLRWKNKEFKFLYFRSPRLVNLHGNEKVPKLREDGLMEVIMWEFNTSNKFSDDHLHMSLKLRCYEGTMSGLIVYGIEFRPI